MPVTMFLQEKSNDIVTMATSTYSDWDSSNDEDDEDDKEDKDDKDDEDEETDENDENDENDQGKHTSLVYPQYLAEVHPFTPVLQKWEDGVGVDCGEDWTWDTIEDTIEVSRGLYLLASMQDS